MVADRRTIGAIRAQRDAELADATRHNPDLEAARTERDTQLAQIRANADPATVALLEQRWADNPINPLDGTRHLHVTWASEIAPKPVHWLWSDRYIPQAELSLLGGREGVGKSTIGYDLTASLTRGKLPGVHHGTPARVLVAATEDSWEHTIVPRLIAAGADLCMVGRVDVITEEGDTAPLTLPADLWHLEDAVAAHQVALILLDPLISRLDKKLDTHRDSEVRQALEPLVNVAHRSGASILGLIHVNKSGGADPVNAIMGSRAFTAVARTTIVAMRNPHTDGPPMVCGVVKSNLGPTGGELGYRLEEHSIGEFDGHDIRTTKISWLGQHDQPIAEMMEDATQGEEVRSVTQEAVKWLEEYLRSVGGKAESKKVKDEARRAGVAERTLQRARQRLRVVMESSGGWQRGTYWTLPIDPLDSLSCQIPLTRTTGTTGTSGGSDGAKTLTTASYASCVSPEKLAQEEKRPTQPLTVAKVPERDLI